MDNKDVQKSVDGYDWVIYLAGDWGQFYHSLLIQELAQRLPQSRFLCVARPMCLLTGLLRRPREFFTWLERPGQITVLEKNLLYVRPGVLVHDHLAGFIPLARQINWHWLRHQLRAAVARAELRWGHLIALIYDPFQLEYLNLVEESLSIYNCYDEYAAGPGIPCVRTRNQVLKREQAIFKQIDLVFVVSEILRSRVERMHHRVYVVPNGVDARHFGQVADPTMEVAPVMVGVPHPIVGYLGNITPRIDFGLIKHLAASYPEWAVVLVGRMSQAGFSIPKSLASLPNVHYLGSISYETLPSYLKAFDVCIIPYVTDDPVNISCSPLKLYEYLAIGKPIVSTDLPAVRPFKGLVRIAENVAEFGHQVKAALEERDEDLLQRRLTAARENSWEQRAESILEILASVLPESGLER